MPNSIQPPEYSKGSGTGGISRISDGDPNLLNANRNDDGQWLNAYYDNPDNRWNRESGFAFAVSQISSFLSLYLMGELCFVSCPFHPPSILPASSSFTDSAMYFLSSRDFVSHSTINSIRSVSIFLIASRTYGCFSSRERKLAAEIASINSIDNISIL
jgi:hypothetical protein